jgi:VanZ family protein
MGWFKNFRYVFIWGAIILALSLIPGTHIPRIPDFYQLFKPDKIIHLAMFGVFSLLLLLSLRRQYGYAFFRYYGIIIGLTISFLYGGLTEYLQFITNLNRSGNIYDFIANAAGSLLGLLVMIILLRKKEKASDN